jgi:hypothetical protein
VSRWLYGVFFFAARNFAQRARAAAAILFLPAAEIVRVCFTGGEPKVFPADAAAFDPFRAFAQRNFCAALIRFRAEADMVRPGLA